MLSVVDRNVVMRRMTAFSRTSDLIVAVLRWLISGLSSWRQITS